jgi:RNA ligase
VKLTELFSLEQLDWEIFEGYVKRQKHPFLPLDILNYTDKATYDRRWNDVTTHCRGLIVDRVTHEVIARGPRKFFNYGEPDSFQYELSTAVDITTKQDGSLGIGWYYVDEDENCHWGIATRGSFTSEQALHATALVKEFPTRAAGYELLLDTLAGYRDEGLSYICEIIYPENRIVLDYGERDELIPLGCVNNSTGLITYRPSRDHYGYELVANSNMPLLPTLADALALPIPDDEEGYVLDILNEQGEVVDHLKLKGDRYKELHAAIFGLSEKAIWEQMVEGTHFDFIAALPDEVQPWAQEVSDRLGDEYESYFYLINYVFDTVSELPSRREQAEYLRTHHLEIMSPLFSLVDGKVDRLAEWIWKKIKPGHVPFSASKALESASV